MIGHSVGEFVAATLAGVFALADALRLVARRGAPDAGAARGRACCRCACRWKRCWRACPPTCRWRPRTRRAPAWWPARTKRSARFQAQLEADGVACRALRTSHAFHSAMMDPVVAPFRAEVAAVPRAAPTLPIVSTVSGDWLDAATRCRPTTGRGTCASRCASPARSARVLDAPRTVLLEVGPRATLSTLARQHPALQQQHAAAIASLTDAPAAETAQHPPGRRPVVGRGVAIDPALFDRRDAAPSRAPADLSLRTPAPLGGSRQRARVERRSASTVPAIAASTALETVMPMPRVRLRPSPAAAGRSPRRVAARAWSRS